MGRPPLYNTAEELQKAIDAYFDSLDSKPPTITGLCYHLGFESRQSFYDYEEKADFTYTVKRARLRIENNYEEKLLGNACTGSIFALKNMGWKDKTEQELTGSLGVTWNEQRTYETK